MPVVPPKYPSLPPAYSSRGHRFPSNESVLVAAVTAATSSPMTLAGCERPSAPLAAAFASTTQSPTLVSHGPSPVAGSAASPHSFAARNSAASFSSVSPQRYSPSSPSLPPPPPSVVLYHQSDDFYTLPPPPVAASAAAAVGGISEIRCVSSVGSPTRRRHQHSFTSMSVHSFARRNDLPLVMSCCIAAAALAGGTSLATSAVAAVTAAFNLGEAAASTAAEDLQQTAAAAASSSSAALGGGLYNLRELTACVGGRQAVHQHEEAQLLNQIPVGSSSTIPIANGRTEARTRAAGFKTTDATTPPSVAALSRRHLPQQQSSLEAAESGGIGKMSPQRLLSPLGVNNAAAVSNSISWPAATPLALLPRLPFSPSSLAQWVTSASRYAPSSSYVVNNNVSNVSESVPENGTVKFDTRDTR